MSHPLSRFFTILVLAGLSLVLPTSFALAKEESRTMNLTPLANNSLMLWNLVDREEPLLNLPENVQPDLDLNLTFPFGQFGIPLSQSLQYNAQTHRYLLMLTSDNGRKGNFLELRQVGSSRTYATNQSPGVELIDQGSIKVLRGTNGNQYSFIAISENELRCIQIQDRMGAFIRLRYNSEGLLDGLSDNAGRTLSVGYANNHVAKLVQTWSVAEVKMIRSWNPAISTHENLRYETSLERAPRFGLAKSLPTNAMISAYSVEMAECDRMLARIFGGPGAVAAANSFEPAALSGQYPIYRGDLRGSDGVLRRGHLSFAMHLYGSEDGTATTPLYVPTGFTSHTTTPTPTDAAITFFYPRLGNFSNVTLAVFHVADFAIKEESGRIRIGNIGGRGGSFELYKHSHIEFYRGNTGLPASNKRQALRIDPALVFSTGYDSVRLRTIAQR